MFYLDVDKKRKYNYNVLEKKNCDCRSKLIFFFQLNITLFVIFLNASIDWMFIKYQSVVYKNQHYFFLIYLFKARRTDNSQKVEI